MTWRHAADDLDCPKRGAMEPIVMERPDGILLMLIRTQMGHVYQSLSKDGGDRWSEAVPSVLKSQEAPMWVRIRPWWEAGRVLSSV